MLNFDWISFQYHFNLKIYVYIIFFNNNINGSQWYSCLLILLGSWHYLLIIIMLMMIANYVNNGRQVNWRENFAFTRRRTHELSSTFRTSSGMENTFSAVRRVNNRCFACIIVVVVVATIIINFYLFIYSLSIFNLLTTFYFH